MELSRHDIGTYRGRYGRRVKRRRGDRRAYNGARARACFRGHKGHIIKILSHDDQGFCLFTKRLTDGCFAWPTTKDQVAVSLTKALILCRFCFRKVGLSGM
ncbi:IS66 family insertion sequence element accessory protein TnpB [Mesorhizobium sp. M0514]|uniref:IS66 family insertion sequence element accessory protein TnpB n=1 Tax=Mesorhizobium sp. M0514 TaxID=2956955 RepID=UPI00333D4BB6